MLIATCDNNFAKEHGPPDSDEALDSRVATIFIAIVRVHVVVLNIRVAESLLVGFHLNGTELWGAIIR